MINASFYREPRLKRQLELGEFAVSVQIDPPSVDNEKSPWQAMDEFRKLVMALKDSGAKLIDINSSRGKNERVFMTSTQLAGQILDKFGIETIPHITTRDLSLAGLINEIETTFAIGGVANFLVITGDPHDANQNFPHNGVFEVDSIGAIMALNQYLRPREVFSIAAAVNQNRPKTEAERLSMKLDAGADFFMSQTVFSVRQAEETAEFCAKHRVENLLIGIWPLDRFRLVEKIRHATEQPGKTSGLDGIVLDNETFESASKYQNDPLSFAEWGKELAAETLKFIRDNRLSAGAYIVAPSRKPLLSMEILRMSGLIEPQNG